MFQIKLSFSRNVNNRYVPFFGMNNIRIPICDVFRGKITSNIIESITSSIKANTNMMHPCPFKVKWTRTEIWPNNFIKYNCFFPTRRTISMREIFLYTYHSCLALRPAAIIWCKLLLCESEEGGMIFLDKSKCILTFSMNKIKSVSLSTLNKIRLFKIWIFICKSAGEIVFDKVLSSHRDQLVRLNYIVIFGW